MVLKNIKKAGNKDDDNCIKQANWKKITFMKVTVGSGEQIENLKWNCEHNNCHNF